MDEAESMNDYLGKRWLTKVVVVVVVFLFHRMTMLTVIIVTFPLNICLTFSLLGSGDTNTQIIIYAKRIIYNFIGL